MKIDTAGLAALLKAQIENYSKEIKTDSVGTVVTVGDGIASIYGLDEAMLGELLLFPHGVYGMAMNLNSEDVGAVLLGNDEDIKEGDEIKRTGKVVEVPVGDELLGRVVNALGAPIDGKGPIKAKASRPIERIAPGVMKRKSVDTPLMTGIKAIDAMIPIGRGQRELIIGDRQTGKTAIALDAIINQKNAIGKKIKCVYCAIGQKNSSVASLVEKLRESDCLSYCTVVSASSSEPAPLLYIAPFAAMAMAEEWMEKGEDVLIVFDDLSKHAVAYRALSLLLKRSPGREAYPGDIFYLHSRLLERACRLNEENGSGSITALPIVETQAGDISAYIPTNVISITDGQIFLLTDYFNAGQRPAIDSGFSVSRVGSSAQFKAMKKVAASLKIELASYREMLSFSQFGSDLDSSTKKILSHGAVLMEALKQPQYSPFGLSKQVIALSCVKTGLLDDLDLPKVNPLLDDFYARLRSLRPEIVESIDSTFDLTNENAEAIKEELSAYLQSAKE
ncbi:MAG: F0F1 ATP synthase subunit alpha [Firmicutes bacterium]|uniref:ATP synthase subunit alpha n=1 Tax=Candidatus Alloenteromonas pullistercoris TaxID=2840785 RepID=A0A9D9DDQ8_9FIRM|nr:F0F1 ATP synthase subunit alpha [Candidatus Enteromonas pullistercoris]